MSIVLKLQKLPLADIHREANVGLPSLISTACPTTGVAENAPFEME